MTRRLIIRLMCLAVCVAICSDVCFAVCLVVCFAVCFAVCSAVFRSMCLALSLTECFAVRSAIHSAVCSAASMDACSAVFLAEQLFSAEAVCFVLFYSHMYSWVFDTEAAATTRNNLIQEPITTIQPTTLPLYHTNLQARTHPARSSRQCTATRKRL